ncbi:MAG: hypothetical protein ABSB82_06045 [Terriglobia bacterium]
MPMEQWPLAQQAADEQQDFPFARTATDHTLGTHQNVSATSSSQAFCARHIVSW